MRGHTDGAGVRTFGGDDFGLSLTTRLLRVGRGRGVYRTFLLPHTGILLSALIPCASVGGESTVIKYMREYIERA